MYPSRETKERIGAGIRAVVFLVLFAGPGAVLLWGVGKSVHDGWRARSWVPVQVEIVHVDTGTATFAYSWEGKRYASERVGTFVLGGSTDVDDWEDRMDETLSAAVEGKRPAFAFVNPADPAEAILDREIRWKLMALVLSFGLAFTLGGIIAFVAVGRRAIGIPADASVPLLKPRAREALTQWTVGIVWNVVALPVALIAVPEFWASGAWFPVVLLALFATLGLVILWSALSSTVAVLREGSPFNARTAS